MKKNFILLKTDNNDNFVISELLEETETQLVVKYPVVLRVNSSVETISVYTTKLMPFSMNNVVAFTKTSIIALTKPNERIIEYYLNFLAKYSEIFDDLIEKQVLDMDMTDEFAEEEPELYDEEPDEFVVQQTSNNTIH